MWHLSIERRPKKLFGTGGRTQWAHLRCRCDRLAARGMTLGQMRRTMLERASSTGSRARRDAGESGTDEVLGWGIATMKRATMAGDTSRRLEGRARVWSRVAINSGVSRHAEVPTECLCRTSPELRVPFLHGSGKWTLSTAMWSGATQSTEADAPVAPSASWMTTQRRVTMWRTRFTKTHSRKRSSWA